MVVGIETYALIGAYFFAAFILGYFISGRSRIFFDFAGLILLAMVVVFGSLLLIEDNPSTANIGFIVGAVVMIFIAFRVRMTYTQPMAKMKYELDTMYTNKDFTDYGKLQFEAGYDHLKSMLGSQHHTLNLLLNVIDELSRYERQTITISDTINKLTEKISSETDNITTDIEQSLQSAIIGNEISEKIQKMVKDMADDYVYFNQKLSKAINSADILSDQTNLVAVNAAIEAANSEQESANFAIVADGIQRLSSRSKETAGELSSINVEISKMIKQRLNEIVIEFANLDNIIYKIADVSDKLSTVSHQQKGIGDDLRAQLAILRERREVVLKNRLEFTY